MGYWLLGNFSFWLFSGMSVYPCQKANFLILAISGVSLKITFCPMSTLQDGLGRCPMPQNES
jgi:hypothetical protein